MVDTVLTVPGLLERAARLHPQTDAIVFPDRRQTYAELEASALEVARSLVALGISAGDAVGALMPNCHEFVHLMHATAMIGALFVPINARLAPQEVAYIVGDSGVNALLTTDVIDEHVDYVGRITGAFPELADAAPESTPALAAAPDLRDIVVLGAKSAPGLTSRARFLALGEAVDPTDVRSRSAAVEPRTPYIMMYTSGTTARPKGCPLAHESVVRLGAAVGDEVFHITSDDRMWIPLPMFHVAAQAEMVAMLNACGTYVAMTHFEPSAALDYIERERVTLMFPAYPTLTGPLLNHPQYTPDSFRRVRVLLTVGPPDLLRDYQSKLPHTTHISCYGSTETGGNAVMGRLEDSPDERVTSGKPFAGVEVRIRDQLTGQQVPAGETGLIDVRGFNVFLGYHNDPRKTADSIDADGWFDTGDLGSIDERGNLVFRGRAKDVLKVGGENVGCLEVESYLLSHPDVIIAAVVGIPDPHLGEIPAAFVEVREGSTLTADELTEYCRQGLARYKIPRHIRFTTDWPMSATKIQKFGLRDRLLAEHEAEQPAPTASVS